MSSHFGDVDRSSKKLDLVTVLLTIPTLTRYMNCSFATFVVQCSDSSKHLIFSLRRFCFITGPSWSKMLTLLCSRTDGSLFSNLFHRPVLFWRWILWMFPLSASLLVVSITEFYRSSRSHPPSKLHMRT